MTVHKNKTIVATALAFLSFFHVTLGRCEIPLVFVSAPDIHNIETFLQTPPPTKIPEFDLLLNNMASFKPSFVLLPGDLGGQHWWEAKFQPICAPGASVSTVITACAAKTYPRLLSYMASHGLPNAYVAVGDHEIGDNNWPLGVHSAGVPIFKQAFAKYFTKTATGASKFIGLLGNVPLRPIGTPYENTAYAFKTTNTLFVVVDEFRQVNVNQLLGKNGTVQATVSNDGQLQWLDKLLAAARTQPTIKHILVVGHLPVLSPVRGLLSSMMYLDGWHNSAFWSLLRKYKVDAYLAGEVHQTTVNKDPNSPLIQIVHKGGCCQNGLSGFIVGRIYSNRLEFDLQKLTTNSGGAKSFVKEGTLVIDKSLGFTRHQVSGTLLKPIDPDGLFLHYSFDGDISKVVKNQGTFGASYDAVQHNIYPVPGVLGQAAWFGNSQQSRISSTGINPLEGQRPRSISLWLLTAQTTAAYIYPSGQFWDVASFGTNAFRLLLANGILKLQLDPQTQVAANQGALRLNDYKWHHVTVTFERNWITQKDQIFFYVDGQKYGVANTTSKVVMTNINSDTVIVGGRKAGDPTLGWTGSLDDFAIWSSALTPTMVKAIKTCAQTLAYNASDMEALFNLYRKRTGSVVVKGRTWKYHSPLSSTEGVCMKQANNSYTLKLDALGQGVTTP